MARCIAAGQRVVHIASHSFTPVLHGVVRQADVAWLYDPRRAGEGALAAQWLAALRRLRPDLQLRRNDPYHGTGDGLTNLRRRRHTLDEYVGVELEVNQRCVQAHGMAASAAWDALRADVVASLRAVMGGA